MITNNQKFFPIKSATACKLKWTWTALYLNTGLSATCHRTAHYPLTVENFDNFHNNEVVVKDRQLMLEGKWPEENCSYCRKIEEQGGVSDRIQMLSIPGGIPPELDTDVNAVHVTPRILEVFINNVCNLACLYCREELSSRINQENRRFGNFESNGLKLTFFEEDHSNELFQPLLNWLENNYQHLERLHFLGGEPFYQKEFDILLEFLAENKNSKCEINIVTNLMIAEEKLDHYCAVFKRMISTKKIRRLDLTCSIDCWGKEQEFVRYGLNLTQWEKNFTKLINIPWIVLHINQTITALTIKTMPALINKIQEWRKVHPVGHFFSVAAPGPSYMNPGIFGPEEFKKDFEIILEIMPKETDDDRLRLEYMKGITNEYNNSKFNKEEVIKLITYLDEKDRRRNTNWETTFPWLTKYRSYVV